MEEQSNNRIPEPDADNILTSPVSQRRDRIFKELYEWVESAVLAVVFVVLLFTFVARTSVVSGESMIQTLQSGDMLVVSRLGGSVQPGNIVVATKPYYANEPIIKRVIATGGQSVDIDFVEGVVYVNGEALDEVYANTPTNRKYDMDFPLTVPEGYLFLMGDNRNGSLDSRSTDIGLVDERYILGRAYWRIMPFSSMGKLDTNAELQK
ncbi:MAG TPA: signal peptidase I [Clostridia bacterium]|nr:signal peptidase I [Clostridia bacterium]